MMLHSVICVAITGSLISKADNTDVTDVPVAITEQAENTHAAFNEGGEKRCPGMIVNEWAISAAGYVRTGLKDSIRFDKTTLASLNAVRVSCAVALCEQYERPVVIWSQARAILRQRGVAA